MTDSDKRQEKVIAAGGPSREITFLQVSGDATFSLALPPGSVVNLWPWNWWSEEVSYRQSVLVRLYGTGSVGSTSGLVHKQPTDTEYKISLDSESDRVGVYVYIALDLPNVTVGVPEGVTIVDNR